MIWPRYYRIRKRATFQYIQREGFRKRSTYFLILYLKGSSSNSRIGITVSKKVGNSVVRNRIKRWLREGLRKEYSNLKGIWDIVIIAYPRSVKASSKLVQKEIGNAFSFLSKKSQ